MPIEAKFDSQSSTDGPLVHCLYDEATGSWQYVCVDQDSKSCAIIDPILDFDPASARTSTESAEVILRLVESEGYKVDWILDTHPHADHLTAGHWLAQRTAAPHGIGQKVRDIAILWRDYYNQPQSFVPDNCFDRLFADGDSLQIGRFETSVMLSSGHTLGSLSYVTGDAIFAHDTLMHVDVGTARADFPGGSSLDLWNSIQALLALPDESRVFVGHDYGTESRTEPACVATVAEHRKNNPHVGGTQTRSSFIDLRDKRDDTLGLPDRMLYALQVNLRGGRLPEPEDDGHSYFKIPANKF
ncbi:MBL fold metallo-hydrolase [Loktanella sp. 3ANDIMAR09]|uniref:MBL fold metallo-hydrolase n=1 Tax=Loktanella sp. 3ANDIMAR09 TaxID=1225657 RepID=UPI0009FA8ABD|nr:MBL fold metallo-hydrolase [Loktanella sp. 3ANDIMAR09]